MNDAGMAYELYINERQHSTNGKGLWQSTRLGSTAQIEADAKEHFAMDLVVVSSLQGTDDLCCTPSLSLRFTAPAALFEFHLDDRTDSSTHSYELRQDRNCLLYTSLAQGTK